MKRTYFNNVNDELNASRGICFILIVIYLHYVVNRIIFPKSTGIPSQEEIILLCALLSNKHIKDKFNVIFITSR